MPRAKPENNLGKNLSAEVLEVLRDPAMSLQLHAVVIDQSESIPVPFDPFRITEHLQETIVGYVSDPPQTEDGYTRWLTVLGGRQNGKSLTGELAFYPKAAYNEGWDHCCIADTRERADYLHQRVQFTHKRWPEEYRQAQQSTNELRSLTFWHDGKMRVLAGGSEGVGVGNSPDSFHGSELFLWKNAAKQFSMINPGMINRKRAMMLLESTAGPLNFPSARWWKDKCSEAKKGKGRNIYAFFPFWDGKLCRREWPKGAKLDAEEEKLLKDYAHKGLRIEHLAFRRLMLETDPEISKDHRLFGVYYPFDDINCWLSSASTIIPAHAIERHAAPDRVIHWDEDIKGYHQFRPPIPGANYAIFGDPAGWGSDHSAFHVFECWEDSLEQVGVYGQNIDPAEFVLEAAAVGRLYNNALIAMERNGAGVGANAGLQLMEYPNLYYAKDRKPGVHKHSHDEYVTRLVSALIEDFELYDSDTIDQLSGYQNDKLVERTIRAEMVASDDGGRRPRHHWDKVAALMIGAVIKGSIPRGRRPNKLPPNVIPYNQMSWDALQAYELEVARAAARRQNVAGGGRTRPPPSSRKKRH